MKITVFGAAGSVGQRVVTEALSRGHEVTAVVRDASRSEALPADIKVREGDAGNLHDVIALTQGQDLVITATRPPEGYEPELVRTTQTLLQGLAETKVRLLVSGGAAPLTVPGTGHTVLDAPDFLPPEYKAIALACFQQLQACQENDQVDWAYLCPAAMLEPGTRTGNYRLGSEELVVGDDDQSRISIEDLAVVLIDEAEQPRHQRTYFTAGY